MAGRIVNPPEVRRSNTEMWWRSRVNSGKASICPECGGYTTRTDGMHKKCSGKRR